MSAHLAAIPTSELRRLLDAIEHGRVSVPLRSAKLHAEGLPTSDVIAVLGSLDRDPLRHVLCALVSDRELRAPPHLDLVWTGPETRGATSRDTAVLVRELFAQAKQSVLIAGFSFDHGAEIFAPLHAVMKTSGVTTEIFLDIRDPAPPGIAPHDHAHTYVTAFLNRNWAFGPPFPTLYYDPRSAEARASASLHAKCIVVDVAKTLITSANFTNRGQTRNIELGVVIEDREFAAQVSAQWRSIVHSGDLVEFQRAATLKR